jgi:hypothetical protein
MSVSIEQLGKAASRDISCAGKDGHVCSRFSSLVDENSGKRVPESNSQQGGHTARQP